MTGQHPPRWPIAAVCAGVIAVCYGFTRYAYGLFVPEFADVIPPVLTDAREADTLTVVEVPNGSRFHLVSRYEEVKAVMTRSDVFSRGLRFDAAPRLTDGDITQMQGSLMNMEGGEHRRIRNPLSGFFNRGAVQAIGPTVALIATEVLDALESRAAARVDVLADYVKPMVTGFASTFMGVSPAQWGQAQDLIHAQLNPNLAPDQTRQAGQDLIALAEPMLVEAPGMWMLLPRRFQRWLWRSTPVKSARRKRETRARYC